MDKIKVRPALATDLPAIVTLDIAANPNHPVMNIVYKQYSHLYAMFLSRYLHMLYYPKKYQFLVATIPSSKLTSGGEPEGEELVGFIVGSTPKEKNEKNGIGGEEGAEGEKEWKPIFPEGTNTEFMTHYLGVMRGDSKRYQRDDCWELVSLSVAISHQRKGIGHKLITKWLKTVDADGRGARIRSSAEGKGLYERFGFVEIGKSVKEWKEWGFEIPLRVFYMIREGMGNGGV